MSRRTATTLGTLALLAAGMAMSRAVGAEGDPIKRVDRRVQVLRLGGGKLGVRLEDVDRDDVARLKLSAERGAIVKSVEADTPAQKAGLQEGDVIVRYEGESVLSVAQLVRLVRETPGGRTVALEVSRGGNSQKLSATLAEGPGRMHVGDFDIDLPDVPEPTVPPIPPIPPIAGMFHGDGKGRAFLFGDRGPRKLGIEYQELSGQLAQYFKVDKGVLVTSVDENGPAAKAGLKAGDVIVKFDGQPIADADDLRDRVRRAEGGKDVSITVQREGRAVDLKAKLAAPESRARGGDST